VFFYLMHPHPSKKAVSSPELFYRLLTRLCKAAENGEQALLVADGRYEQTGHGDGLPSCHNLDMKVHQSC